MRSDSKPQNRGIPSLFYLALLVPLGFLFAEIMAIYFSSVIGLLSYSLLMQLIFIHAAVNWQRDTQRFFLVMSLIPVMRILAFSLPLAGLSEIYWYVVMSVPLFLTCLYVMRTLEIKWGQIGIRIRLRRVPHALLLALSGIAVGTALYRIEPPPPGELPTDLALLGFYIVVWIIFVAGIEEFIFRGIILHSLRQLWGSTALSSIYIALVYTILHVINHGAGLFLIIIFSFSLTLNLAASIQPRSIIGTTLAHGLLNVMYFVILPLASGQ